MNFLLKILALPAGGGGKISARIAENWPKKIMLLPAVILLIKTSSVSTAPKGRASLFLFSLPHGRFLSSVIDAGGVLCEPKMRASRDFLVPQIFRMPPK